jgi:superfamily II DNA or RNA helicase
MQHLVIRNKDEAYIHIECAEGVAWELRDAFSFRPPGFQFVPSYKQKLWDGWLRLFDANKRIIYRGLAPQVMKWITEKGYTYTYEDEVYDTSFSLTDAKSFVEGLNPKHAPRDYQLQSFVHAIRSKRRIVLSPTGSGKSLLLYLICNYLLKQGKRGLLIVPRSALVEQMFSDFQDYSEKNGKDMEKYCHRVYSGHDKVSDKPIIISTWQSLQRLPKEYFQQFDYVICDEVHQAQAKALTDIVTKCTKAEYRVGVTGTLSGAKAHEWVLIGLFGQVYKATTSKELMDKKQLAELTIKCLMLKYSEEECQYMKTASYQEEIDYIVSNPARNKFIVNLALSLEGNTLLLFNFVEKHGDVLYAMLNKKVKEGRKVFYIHGGTDVEDREEIRRIVENEKDAIIVGSVGVLSTGTNIVRLDNIIFASPSKSKIRNLQSIGRGLRVSDTKQSAILFDLADDFTWKSKENFTLKHFFERVKIYSEEGFKFKVYKIQMKD